MRIKIEDFSFFSKDARTEIAKLKKLLDVLVLQMKR